MREPRTIELMRRRVESPHTPQLLHWRARADHPPWLPLWLHASKLGARSLLLPSHRFPAVCMYLILLTVRNAHAQPTNTHLTTSMTTCFSLYTRMRPYLRHKHRLASQSSLPPRKLNAHQEPFLYTDASLPSTSCLDYPTHASNNSRTTCYKYMYLTP
ncbi:hypothetical protein B0H16DRAFT_352938 [Mycena metata]|uniref:Uncharacterized protein n=1 Tax=Mycena metata TaxID=1033252 RepID=A0AAD7JL80_9AGAR|nr:hypothetical protein B0H16DRAFT_352938 [Mycena metata]